MARSFRSRCFSLLIFIKMSLCFHRWSSGQDADCTAALDINNVEQTPVYRHPDDSFSRLALDNASINHTKHWIDERLASCFEGNFVLAEICLRHSFIPFKTDFV